MTETETQWMTNDTAKGEMELRFHLLPLGYFVGGKHPRTLRCATCGKVAIRTTYHFVHHQVIALDRKNSPESRNVVACPVPSPLTGAQRDLMTLIRDRLPGERDKVVLAELQKRNLVDRNSRGVALTPQGLLLLEEGW